MRIAVIACSPYSQCKKLTELSSVETDVDILGQRLSEPDAGFVVHSFRAERGLPEAVDQVLAEASEPVDELLFYFAGYAVLNDERGPALLLDGERLSAFSLKRLRRVLAERARSSLAVLDTVPAFDGQMNPKDAVQVVATALADPTSRVHLIAASRPENAVFGRSPFASLFELVLDWQSVSGSPVRVEGFYSAMRAEESLFAEVPAAEYYPGAEPFELLRPQPMPALSDPPPSVGEQSAPSTERASEPEAPPPSEVTPTQPRGLDAIAALREADAASAEPLREALSAEPVRDIPEVALVAPVAPSGEVVIAPSGSTEVAAAPSGSSEVATAPSASTEIAAPATTEPTREVSGIGPMPSEPVKKSVPPPLPKRAPKTPAAPKPPKAPPTNAELRALALERLTASMANGAHLDAIEHARAALRFEPRDADTYRALNMLFEKLGRPDGCWNVACVLDAAGMADVNESMLAGLHRPDGLLAAKGVLGEDDWRRRLLYPERDGVLDALFVALGSAAVEVGAETARRKRRLPALDTPAEDPAKSTTTLARTLVWSSRLLGIPTPALHVVDGVAGDIAAAPTVAAAALASKSLGSGLSLPELAFLWARRLVMFRPEHRIAAFLPNAAELEDFVRAAYVLGAGSERAFKRLEGDQKLFGRGLKRHLRGIDRGPLEAAAKAIAKESIPAAVSAFRRSIELAAGRAGLLATGELSLALRMTERFPQHGPVTREEQSADLFTYSVSDEYAALRERLGVALRG